MSKKIVAQGFLQEQKKEEKIEIAKAMKKDNKSLEEIQKYTQLLIEEIQNL